MRITKYRASHLSALLILAIYSCSLNNNPGGNDDAAWGDTITTIGGVTYYIDHDMGGDSVPVQDLAAIRAVKDGKVVRQCLVKGPYVDARLWNGGQLYFTCGIDSVGIDLKALPEEVDMTATPLTKDGYRLAEWHDGKIVVEEGERRVVSFSCTVYCKADGDNTALGLAIDEMFGGYADTRQEAYKGDMADIDSLIAHYGKLFMRTAQPETFYNYINCYVTPFYSDAQGLTTYRFVTMAFGGGAHSLEETKYVTVSPKDRRIMEYEDLVGEGTEEQVFWLFDTKSGGLLSDVGQSAKTLPRPAITKQGAVFSWQEWELGGITEGGLHMVLPFKPEK